MIRTALKTAFAATLFAAAPAAAQLRVDKPADLSVPVTLGPNQGAIVVGFRRPDKMSAGKSAAVAFLRYDVAKRDLILQPKAAKKSGDMTTYSVLARTKDKKLPLEYAVMIVSAGDYVMAGASPGPARQVLNSFCLKAPTFSVKPGEIIYFGDVTPYVSVALEDGRRVAAMPYSSHLDDARAGLARQPALAALKAADLRNDASYACAAQIMTAYAIPGAPALEPVAPSEASATGE